MELWKPIKDFEAYEISNKGRIRKGDKILKPFDNNGYERILLSNGKEKRKFLIHRLVAIHFIPTEDYSMEVNHKDTNKKNNNADNLEWVTTQQNIKHYISSKEGRMEYLKKTMSEIGKEHGKKNALKSQKPVRQLSLDGETIKEFPSARKAGEETGSSYKHISACCNGKRKTHNGFKWEFVK